MFLTHALRAIYRAAVVTGDSLWKYVSLLLSGTAPAQAFNADASINNNVLTIVGDTKPSNFNPYTPGYYSNYFDGTGDYLTAASNSAFYLSTGNWTVEAWVYKSATGKKIIIGQTQNNAAPYSGWLIYVDASEKFVFEGNNGALLGSPTVTVPLNSWTHLAAVKSGSTLTLYQNGVSVNSGTVPAITDYSVQLTIGSYPFYTAGAEWNGYISNLRLVKGTAVYTAAFTPPTAPLTAITNTSLLTCQSKSFVDNSSNNFTLTRNGDVAVKSMNPFQGVTKGSMYFDGTGDYLVAPNNEAFKFGAGDFTIECWVYLSSFADGKAILTQGWPTVNAPYLIYTDTTVSKITLYLSSNGSSWDIAAGVAIVNSPTANTWYHIAVTRSGSTVRTFANGVQTSTFSTMATLYNAAYPLTVAGGVTGANNLNGYIADLRLTKAARYTANFTPPTAPLPTS